MRSGIAGIKRSGGGLAGLALERSAHGSTFVRRRGDPLAALLPSSAAPRQRHLRTVHCPRPVPKARNVVLVHGAYADGSCWSDVIPHLQARGLNVASVQNPLRTLDEDCEFACRTLALVTSPTAGCRRLLFTRLAREGPVQPVRGYVRRVRQPGRDASIAGIRIPLG